MSLLSWPINWLRTRWHSLSYRLALLTSFAAALSVVIVSVSAYSVTRLSMYRQLDEEMISVAYYTSAAIGNDLSNMTGLNVNALKVSNTTLMIERADGQVLRLPGETVNLLPSASEMSVARTQFGSSARTGFSSDGGRYRIVAVPLQLSSGNYALILGKPLNGQESTLQLLTHVLLWVSGVGTVLSVIIGWNLGRSILSPLRDLNVAVSRVAETDNLEPIAVKSDDELGIFARSFNAMLSSLTSSRERQKRFIADAGHELRTPLTSMRTNVELMIADQRSHMLSDEARQEILQDVAAQLGEFSSLIGDLVQLSREDSTAVSYQLIDLAEIVEESVVKAKRRGPNITFSVQLQPHYLMGDESSLGRAFTNLLDNAVKFSPENGTIFVVMDGDSVTVADEGAGIADEDLPHIFDRFYRSDRSRNTPGTGLGLSIVAQAINTHSGTITAGNTAQGGAKFTVILPKVSPDSVADSSGD